MNMADKFFVGNSRKGLSTVKLQDNEISISNIPGVLWRTSKLKISVKDIIAIKSDKNYLPSEGPNVGSPSRTIAYQRIPDLDRRNSSISYGTNPRTSSNKVTIHFVKRQKSDKNIWLCDKIVLRHKDRETLLRLVEDIEVAFASFLQQRPKRLLVIINPFGGKRKSEEIFKKTVVPNFELAGIECEVVKTERANHGFDLLQTFDLKQVQWAPVFTAVYGGL